MIHNVWILEKSGRLLFHDKLGSIETEEDLLSGFLSAIYSFAETEIGGLGIESMEMGDYNMIYCLSHGLLFVMAADKTDSSSSLKAQIDLIRDSFIDEFPGLKENHEDFLRNWLGDRDKFKKFMFPLRDLIGSWVEVEATTSIAEKMDFLEVFQQIFSRIAKISFPYFREMSIKANLELKLMEIIKAHKSVLNIEELSSIYDSEKTFLDVLSVNVFNPELTVSTLKLTLLDLCKTILDVLQEYMGKKSFGEEFRTHVFPYVKQDWDRIRELELDKFFINYVM
ncbi:hypothetical protein [Candidatus Borrarchaeum sp.]|uniref:hypothetical protein n=1 Tax=Candidatus Borrarchaeum sp. TaxID=2846742 RepID=UPI00257F1791|nr:hypothetical protein [Candidatus Borrarchaeum sp.]